MAALISLRAGNRRRSLDSLENKLGRKCYLWSEILVLVTITSAREEKKLTKDTTAQNLLYLIHERLKSVEY